MVFLSTFQLSNIVQYSPIGGTCGNQEIPYLGLSTYIVNNAPSGSASRARKAAPGESRDFLVFPVINRLIHFFIARRIDLRACFCFSDYSEIRLE